MVPTQSLVTCRSPPGVSTNIESIPCAEQWETCSTRVQTSDALVTSFYSMFVETPSGLQPLTAAWLRDVVCIFDANLTCCRLKHKDKDSCDRESLVLPLLGLWSQVLSDHRMGQGSTLHDIIKPQKDRVFPASFEFEKISDDNETLRTEKHELFGDMIERIERW